MKALPVAALGAALLGGAAFAQAAAQTEDTPAGRPGAAVTVVERARTTVTGQTFEAPPGPLEVVITVTEIPAGGALPMHKHPWPRFAYVERGRLRVRYEAANLVREFGPGEAVVEAVDQWHEGEVVGNDPVRLVVVDQVPPGRSNVVAR